MWVHTTVFRLNVLSQADLLDCDWQAVFLGRLQGMWNRSKSSFNPCCCFQYMILDICFVLSVLVVELATLQQFTYFYYALFMFSHVFSAASCRPPGAKKFSSHRSLLGTGSGSHAGSLVSGEGSPSGGLPQRDHGFQMLVFASHSTNTNKVPLKIHFISDHLSFQKSEVCEHNTQQGYSTPAFWSQF